MQKISIPKGSRDFSPEVMAKRTYIFDVIKNVFNLYGFKQIETPTMENLSTLMGKYGEEGDKLLFKILNSGDFLSKVSNEELLDNHYTKITNKISEKGLRYDLTVPFARYVVMHQNDITFPFKRYQIQPVWRADRPQKGRYREFFQCDVDIIGSDSLLNEVEILQIVDDVFSRLNISVSIKLNNRKILSGISEIIGEKDKIVDITVAIDKLDKIGIEKVKEELLLKGITQKSIDKLEPIISLSGSNEEKLLKLKKILSSSEIGLQGIQEMDTIFSKYKSLNIKTPIDIDLTLARGLNYYTGTIIEVKASTVDISSISGGGRYDNLTGIFGLHGVSGIGISFGADRIYDVMTQLNLFPKESTISTDILFVNLGEKEESYILPMITQLRKKNIKTELYPDCVKMKKQMSYADANKIPFVAIVGEDEIKGNKISLKDMVNGDQIQISLDDLICKINAEL